MSYQFIHIEAYSRSGTKRQINKSGGKVVSINKRSARQIGEEACRIEGACSHVANPQEPGRLYGVSPLEAVDMAEAWAEQKKDPKGRKYRADGSCLLAGVISLNAQDAEKWEAYKVDCLEYLKEQYGPRLKSVVEHLDEANPHLHFYVVPEPTEDFDDIHVGKKAALAVGYSKKTGERNAAYKTAMKAMQVYFHDHVAKLHGFLHFGPNRQRLTRAEWNAQKEQAHHLTSRQQELANLEIELSRKAEELEKLEKDVEWKRNSVLKELEEMPARVEELVREGLEKAKAKLEPRKATILDRFFHPVQELEKSRLQAKVDEQAALAKRYRRERNLLTEAVESKEQDLALATAANTLEKKVRQTYGINNLNHDPNYRPSVKPTAKASTKPTKRSGSSYTP